MCGDRTNIAPLCILNEKTARRTGPPSSGLDRSPNPEKPVTYVGRNVLQYNSRSLNWPIEVFNVPGFTTAFTLERRFSWQLQ